MAFAVVVTHVAGAHLAFQPGVTAVICFYVISGYVIAKQFTTLFSNVRSIPAFYLDRLLRLLPLYFLFAGVTLLLVSTGLITAHLVRECSGKAIVAAFAIIPLNFNLFGVDTCRLVPQAWSLSSEMIFYLVVPLLFLLGGRLLVALFAAGVLTAAMVGGLNPVQYSYLFPWGPACFFLAGTFLAESKNRPEHMFPAALWAVCTAALIAMLLEPSWALGYDREVLAGAVIGIPAVAILRTAQNVHRFDRFLGDLSYGVYLSHFVFIWLFPGFGTGFRSIVLISLCSVVVSAITYLVIERPMAHWRRTLRTTNAPNQRPHSAMSPRAKHPARPGSMGSVLNTQRGRVDGQLALLGSKKARQDMEG